MDFSGQTSEAHRGAVGASVAGAGAGVVDPTTLGRSVVLPVVPVEAASPWWLTLFQLLRMLLALLLQAAGIVCLFISIFAPNVVSVAAGVLALLSTGGFFMLVAFVAPRWDMCWIRHRVAVRPHSVVAGRQPLRYVTLEQWHPGANRTVFGPDDHGLLYCDPANARVVIEGLSHRYVFQAANVLTLEPNLEGSVPCVGLLVKIDEYRAPLEIHFSALTFIAGLSKKLAAERLGTMMVELSSALAYGKERSMYCLKCDYDLRQSFRGSCPECGRAFDAGNPQTFRACPKPPRWFARGSGL